MWDTKSCGAAACADGAAVSDNRAIAHEDDAACAVGGDGGACLDRAFTTRSGVDGACAAGACLDAALTTCVDVDADAACAVDCAGCTAGACLDAAFTARFGRDADADASSAALDAGAVGAADVRATDARAADARGADVSCLRFRGAGAAGAAVLRAAGACAADARSASGADVSCLRFFNAAAAGDADIRDACACAFFGAGVVCVCLLDAGAAGGADVGAMTCFFHLRTGCARAAAGVCAAAGGRAAADANTDSRHALFSFRKRARFLFRCLPAVFKPLLRCLPPSTFTKIIECVIH